MPPPPPPPSPPQIAPPGPPPPTPLPTPPPHRPSLNPPLQSPPPGGLRPTSTGGGGVAYKSEETSPPWPSQKKPPQINPPVVVHGLIRHPCPSMVQGIILAGVRDTAAAPAFATEQSRFKQGTELRYSWGTILWLDCCLFDRLGKIRARCTTSIFCWQLWTTRWQC